MNKAYVVFLVCALALLSGCESSVGVPAPKPPAVTEDSSGTLQLSFSFPSSTDIFKRGMYIWIEDANGNYIDTVEQYQGRTTSNFGADVGKRWANDLCIDWKEAAGEPSWAVATPQNLVIDGVSSATIAASAAGYVSKTWDCLDASGAAVPSGEYSVKAEITYDVGDVRKTASRWDGMISIGSSGDTAQLSSVRTELGPQGNVITRVNSISAAYTVK